MCRAGLKVPGGRRLTPRLTDRLEELPNRDEQFDAVTAANATRNAVIRSWIMAQVNPCIDSAVQNHSLFLRCGETLVAGSAWRGAASHRQCLLRTGTGLSHSSGVLDAVVARAHRGVGGT